MLKIKDNVDLKELEKIGFIFQKDDNMKLEVGMYVRTKKGIGKIDEFRCFMNKYEFHLDNNVGRINEVTNYRFWNDGYDILKSSFNLIDLIKVGDYVNGKEVVSKHYHKKWYLTLDTISNKISDNEISEEDIKSIVTKEQFASMEYKLGE